MKRPMTVLALVYAAGLIAGDLSVGSPTVLLPLSFSLLLLASFAAVARIQSSSVVHPGFRGLASAFLAPPLWLLIFFAGWTNLICHTAPLSGFDLRNLRLEPAELVTLRGILRETPSQRVYVQDDKESYRWLSTIKVVQVKRNGAGWQPAEGNVLVMTPGLLPASYFAGQEVETSGVLTKPPGALAEGLFDYGAYLRRNYVYYQLKTEGTNDWALLSPGRAPPYYDRFLAWAQKTLARGLPEQDEPLKMLWAMTLGWKTVDSRIYEPFMQSGTMHIFAISGLHIALIAGIFVALLRVLRIPRLWCGALIVPLIWFYTGATGWQASAIRSTVMMTIIIGGWALSRPTDLLNSLAAAAFCILLWDPQQLFGASFQLSFFVVLSIALLLPPFEQMRNQLLKTDPLLPAALIPGWKRALLVPVRWITNSVAISLAAWIGSLPLTAYYFHLVSPVTLLANLVIVPLSSCALACNLGSLLCGTWLAPISELFNHSAWFWMNSMIHLSQWAARIPGGFWYVTAPSLAAMSVYYIFAAALLTGWLLAPGRRILTYAAAGAVVLGTTGWWYAERASATITVLPADGGFAVHAHHPRLGPDLLVDAGRSNSVQHIIIPFLHAQGLNRLPGLVLTHGDIRHVEGAELMTSQFRTRHVYASPVRFRSTAYRGIVERLRTCPGLLELVSRDSKLGPWTILHPEKDDRFPQADDNAVVLRGNINGTSILLVSDLGRAGQKALLERYPELHADVVITGLPGAGEPVSDGFLHQVQPRLVVVADSEFPASERAAAAVRARLARSGIAVVYTRASGATTLEMRSGTWQARTMQGLTLDSASCSAQEKRLP